MMVIRFRLDKTAKSGMKITQRLCNIACIWCHYDYFEPRGFTAISNNAFIETVERVLRVTSATEAYVRLAGNGEPTIVDERELADLILRLKNTPKVTTVKMTTNGLLLGKMARTLYNAGIDSVTVDVIRNNVILHTCYAMPN